MSGIAGIYYLDGRPAARADLERMVENMRNRGPDGSGIWSNGSVGLGHVLLHATPEALYDQSPEQDATEQLVITADARLDNREELLAALDFDLTEAGRIPDSRLILAAYEKWGERCPEKLLGDFAFAIWDSRQGELFLARDHQGTKPLYYYLSGRAFIFASEIKALLVLQEVPRRLNEETLLRYFQPLLPLDEVFTWYREIFRLSCHCAMLIRPQGARYLSYWSPAEAPELLCRSDQEYAEAFRHIYTEAVRCRLRSTTPVGIMLSGGIDSSSVVCVARKILKPERLFAFSVVRADPAQCVETPYIQAVLRQTGIGWQGVKDDQVAPFLADLKNCSENQDNPEEVFLMHFPQIVYRLASNKGIKVVATGIDGDGLLSLQLEYLARLLWECKWPFLVREACGLARRFNRPFWKVLLRHGFLPLSPVLVRKAWLRLRHRYGSHDPFLFAVPPLLNPEFAKRMGIKERLEQVNLKNLYITRTPREELLNYLSSGIISKALESFEKMAGAFGLESRHPLTDKRVVEFAMALPWDQKFRKGFSKFILRSAMAGILPEEVRWRRDRENVGLHLTRAMTLPAREYFNQAIADGFPILEKYVDAAALAQVQQRYEERWSLRDALSIWHLATLATWIKRNLS